MSTLLEVQGLAMHFGGIKALDGVDLTIGENEIVGVIGPNGAGKTTLFNVLTGVLRPTAGSVKFLGQQLLGLPADTIVSVCPLSLAGPLESFPNSDANGIDRTPLSSAMLDNESSTPVGASLTSVMVNETLAVLVRKSLAPLVVPLSWSV